MELQKALIRFATKDIKLAKKSGVVCVTDTKEGNIEIVLENEIFTFTTISGNIIGQFLEKEAIKKLASLFVVVTGQN